MKCDYCGYAEAFQPFGDSPKPGDKCPKCKQGIMCLKGSKGSPE